VVFAFRQENEQKMQKHMAKKSVQRAQICAKKGQMSAHSKIAPLRSSKVYPRAFLFETHQNIINGLHEQICFGAKVVPKWMV